MSSDLDTKKYIVKKYVQGLGAIWKKMVDEGPEEGNPLDLYVEALAKTESSLQSLYQFQPEE